MRQVIRLESLGSVPDLSRYAASFNASNEEYYVEVTDLSSTIPNIDDRLKDLSTRLAAGDGPDIICFNGLDPAPYGRAGALLDLYELIDSDPELSREELIALGAFESGDKLWSLAPCFTVSTCVGLESVVGDGLGWTLEDFFALYDSLEAGQKMIATISPLIFVENTLDGVLPELVDYETASCCFTDGKFEEYLRLASGLETADETDWDSYDARFASGEIVLNEQVLRNIYDLAALEEYYGHALTPIGWPSFDGSCGSRLLITSDMGIVSSGNTTAACGSRLLITSDMGIVSSGNTTAAWEFLHFILSDEKTQAELSLEAIPISRAVVEEQLRESGSCSDTMSRLLDGLTHKDSAGSTLSQIVLEEAAAYFAGAKSVEDVCTIIQDRAETYISEQFR